MGKLESILTLQEMLAKKRDFIANIESKLILAKKEISRKQGMSANLESLREQHENLAAKVALGEADGNQLKKIQKEITAEKATAEALKDEAAVIGGLERRLKEEYNSCSSMEVEHRAAIETFLRDEAENIGKEYIALADELEGLFIRLLRITEIHKGYVSPGHDQICSGAEAKSFSIPIFRLASHRGKALHDQFPVTKATTRLHSPYVLEDFIKPERERLVSLGIEL